VISALDLMNFANFSEVASKWNHHDMPRNLALDGLSLLTQQRFGESDYRDQPCGLFR
jgi:hypothetical protein